MCEESLEDIDKKIIKLEEIYEKVLLFKKIITETNFISYKDIDKFKEITKNRIKILDLRKKCREYSFMNDYERIQLDYDLDKYSEIINTNEILINHIYKIFIKYFPKISISSFDTDFQAYKIINLNLDKQKELDSILAEYKSINVIKELLLELYDKRIHILHRI